MIRFHLDQHVSNAIARGLRRRGVDVTTTAGAGLQDASDEQQLQYILASERVIFTSPEMQCATMTDSWNDEDLWAVDETDDDVAAPCPECGQTVEAIADKCPACGYWLSDADRHEMWSSESKPLWLRVTAVIVLAAFLFSLLAIGAALF